MSDDLFDPILSDKRKRTCVSSARATKDRHGLCGEDTTAAAKDAREVFGQRQL